MNENQNRAFLYGESVFTTLRMVSGVMQDWDFHFERLRQSAEFLYGPFTDGSQWVAVLRDRLEEKYSAESGDKIIRITLYLEQANRRTLRPILHSIVDLRISLLSFPAEPVVNIRGTKLRSCPVLTRPDWWPGFLKAGNYLETILAQKIYLKGDDDDLLFISSAGSVLECSVSNIFVVKQNKLFTAPAGPNVLEGVMRKKVLNAAREIFDSVTVQSSTLAQALSADAVFATNSVRGVYLIDRINDKYFSYDQKMISKIESLRSKVFK